MIVSLLVNTTLLHHSFVFWAVFRPSQNDRRAPSETRRKRPAKDFNSTSSPSTVMAHQPDTIPWHLLASNLSWVSGSDRSDLSGHACCSSDCTNLHAIRKGSERASWKFAPLMAKIIQEASTRERAKYPAHYDPPQRDTVIVNDRIARMIERNFDWSEAHFPMIHPNYEPPSPSTPSIRLASAFCDPHVDWGHTEFLERHLLGYFNVQLVMCLILSGEMDTILRACACPGVQLKTWWNGLYCSYPELHGIIGWNMLYRKALCSYIALNVAYCFPDMWDPKTRETEKKDYRNTHFYQNMLRECTACDRGSEFTFHVHQRFFGIDKRQFNAVRPILADKDHRLKDQLAFDNGWLMNFHYGLLPLEEFLILENSTLLFVPHEVDVGEVRGILAYAGKLPLELVLIIMEFADYTPRRRLKVPHDPLHPNNRAALDEYLEHCWQIIVRCHMMAEALGTYFGLSWWDEVDIQLFRLWPCL
ncbi:hypothetical protein AbraIFM66951_001098 [Aspergillus brasiliensis]|uniref:Uncharacterized protein n=1 Tax=Aspergillus brasiliensis TaxID=319629 RepID=A0A9W6DIH6_9EURO|nr:hypothetical protein AbraCBS73388_010097 [Aspergillus brasiliensis]GKZ48856.1 hypothetical protein AbraIFM66951_001098 [Aspergillus brasiliensis]